MKYLKYLKYQNMHPTNHPPKKKNTDFCDCVCKCVPQLPQELINNCKLIASRIHLLNILPKNGIVAEIGIGYGTFSEAIYEICNPKNLYLIDIKKHKSNTLDNLLEKNNIEIKLGKSNIELNKFQDGFFDWIYIDANHSYEYVIQDLNIANNKIKTDGLIICNDYIYYSHVENIKYGVIDAVNEFCIKNNYEIIFLALNPRMYCDVVLKKINYNINT